MPNIEILSRFEDSLMLKAIKTSNQKKLDRDAANNLTPENKNKVMAGTVR
jgi:hypothetical protein